MNITSVSTSYLNNALLPAVQQTQTQLATLEVESASGQYADLGLQLGGNSGYEMSLRTQDDALQALSTANSITSTNLATSQNALTTLQSSAASMAQSLVAYVSGDNSGATLQTLGQSQLQQLISVGNTANSTGGYVFGGQNTAQAPLNDYFAQPTSNAKTSVDNSFQSYFGFSTSSWQTANITPSQMQGFLTGPFATQFQPPQWQLHFSNASSTQISSQISPGTYIDTSTSTDGPAFQQLAQGYTMLSEFGNIGLSAETQKALASTATSVINAGASTLTDAQSSLGMAQNQITQANSTMSNQMTLLQTGISQLDNVDPAQIATQLSTLSTQLQTAYQLTAQISKLNLAQYLPA
jgi:flagellar hook-associated protein 3 FlgL